MKSNVTGKFNHFRITLTAIMLFSILVAIPASPVNAAGQCYVKQNASGLGNGKSWTDAYANDNGLQLALANAGCTEIWVAAGTYLPGGTRDSAFQLTSGVAIYGGFTGTETARSQRKPSTHETILSGDVTHTATNTDNAYHVVIAIATDPTAVLDGFTITGGYADGSSPDYFGGGIYIYQGNPTLSNLNIEYNTASQGGGGICTEYASPTMANITFYSNTVIGAGDGGGLKVHLGKPALTNVTFESNTASSGGGIHSYSDMTITNAVFSNNEATSGKAGGWYIFRGNPVLTNATFYVNSAATEGGAMYISSNTTAPTLTNVTFYGNHADTKGGAIYNEKASGTLFHGTFQDNSAVEGGGAIYNYSLAEGEQQSIRNSILLGDSDEIINFSTYHAIVENSVVAGGYPGGIGIITANPYLGLIGDNGGFSETIPLMAGSSAIDSANDADCPTTDQRGIYRPQGTHCDIGAFEVDVAPVVSSITRLDPSPTSKKSVDFMVIFSEAVNGVDKADFTLVKTGGITGYSITGVSGTGATRTVTVNIGKLNGTLKLNVNDTGTGIKDLPGNDLSGGFTAGEIYTVKKRVSLRSQATYDGWVLEKTEISNTGGSLNRTGHLFVGDNAQDKQYRAIVSFKTAGIPDNAIITHVFLKIKRAGLVGTNPFSTHFNLLADIRKAPFSSNKALRLTDFQASASMNAAGVFNKTLKAGNWYQVTMKKTSRKYVNKKGLTQFRLRFGKDDNDDLNADYLKFFSGNYSNPKYRPLLIIDYYVP